MPERLLLTGGSGRLGRELRTLLPELLAPPHSELDVTNLETVCSALVRYRPEALIHAAAYTDVAGAEGERKQCWRVNVEGTRNLVRAALELGLPLIHLSSDYVFWGDRGGYKEDEAPGPTRNYYALSKLVAEEVVRVLPHHLVIRTSFRANRWPYEVAFDDLYTSQDYLDVIAPEIARAIRSFAEIPHPVLHIATERKSAYDLARRRKPDVRRGSKREAGVNLPDDISLDSSRWQRLKGSLDEL